MTQPPDPRATALAAFLRRRAALFSMSADTQNSSHIADAGMSLLDAATIAQDLSPLDPLLVEMSERRLFETMPGDGARVIESDDLGRSLSRSIIGRSRSGHDVLRDLLAALPPWRNS